jgi:hypothetical protein
MLSMLLVTRSWPPTGFVSTPWRWARGCAVGGAPAAYLFCTKAPSGSNEFLSQAQPLANSEVHRNAFGGAYVHPIGLRNTGGLHESQRSNAQGR